MHIPVLLTEIIGAMDPADGETYIDASFGFGGYSKTLLTSADCHVFAIDRDPDSKVYANALSKAFPNHFRFVQNRFSEIEELSIQAGIKTVDGIVLDIGVSSMQIDQAERGFSFMQDGPLDMRMSKNGETAADIINQYTEDSLIHVFKEYGEEKKARKIAHLIVNERQKKPIETTFDLVSLIERVLGPKKQKIHPATRIFQALRIAVNNELEELDSVLNAAKHLLKPGGRLVVVTFHSLEDRIVKHFFQKESGKIVRGSRYLPDSLNQNKISNFELPKCWRIKPSKEEIGKNPRARSAVLRYGYKAPLLDRQIKQMKKRLTLERLKAITL